MPSSSAACAAIFCLAAALAAQSTGCPRPDPTLLDKLAKDAFTRNGLTGSHLFVEGPKTIVFSKGYGSYSATTVMPVASASKWLTAATVLKLVAEGKIGLDDKISKYLPAFTGTKAGITIRQLLTHTSGLPDDHWSLYLRSITLAQCVDQIAKVALIHTPGTTFHYGSVSFQVAARIVEVVTKLGFEAAVRSRITGPLGMTATDYQAFGKTANPIAAVSVRSSAADYVKFLRMLRDGGVFQGKRILPAALVDEMFRNQIAGKKIVKIPYFKFRPYGLGCLLDEVDPQGHGVTVGHFGALGFCPWIDRARGFAGVYATFDSYFNAAPVAWAVQAWIADSYLPLGVHCLGTSSPTCAGPVRLLADGIPKSGRNGFRLRCLDAPPSSFGILVLGGVLTQPGQPFFGAKVYVAGPPLLLVAPLPSDARGRLNVALPMASIQGPARFLAQLVWLNRKSCAGVGLLSATPALEILVP